MLVSICSHVLEDTKLPRGNGIRLSVCFVLFALIACREHEPTRTAIARIDNKTLTLEDIRSRFDTSRGVSQAQLQQYIQRWLTDELLYREAVQRGLDRTNELNNRLEDIRRQLAINALLDQEVYTDKSGKTREDEVEQYYEAHKREFVLQEDVALMSFVAFSDRDAATSFRNSVLKGTPWNQAITRLNTPVPSVIAVMDSTYYTQSTLFPSELWKVATNIPGRTPSFPVSTSSGFFVLFVWKFARQGDLADARYMAPEIRGRIAIERRRAAYNTLVENLRAKHSVEVFVSSSGQDTVSLKSVE